MRVGLAGLKQQPFLDLQFCQAVMQFGLPREMCEGLFKKPSGLGHMPNLGHGVSQWSVAFEVSGLVLEDIGETGHRLRVGAKGVVAQAADEFNV